VKRFKRIFAFLFVFSLFMGVAHELSHAHHNGEVCEICVFAHAPALFADVSEPTSITQIAERFNPFVVAHGVSPKISLKSRSPPIA
jgi:hypothetical protein